MQEDLSPKKFRHFLYHLKRASEKLDDIDESREKLNKNLSKVKSVSVNREKKAVVENAFEKFEKQLNEVLQKEGFLISAHAEEAKNAKAINEKIAELENQLIQAKKDKEIIENLRLSLVMANQKLNELMEKENDWGQRMVALEEKIDKKITAPKRNEKARLAEQLQELESKYDELNNSGEHDEVLLSKLSSKITSLRKELES
ncbi:MAG: hypothetical protein Q8O89_03540 [Nanoarchaeota archaeon]|nr:hypothetical protein [Nanoarchaeota archaeon]